MDAKLLKLVQDALNAFGGGLNADSGRLGAILPGAMGFGMSSAITATAFGGLLENYYHQQLLDRRGPIATMLRQRARVGARLLRPRGAQSAEPLFFEATIDNNVEKVEEAIAYLAPFRAEQGVELEKVLSQLITPYFPSMSSSANAAPGEVHQGFNLFVPQALQFDLDATASPHGRITCITDNQSRPAIPRHQMTMAFADAGGSRRDLTFMAGSTVYSLTNSIYDALEDTTYHGDQRHYTVDQLREGLEAIFTAAGWSRAVYEENRWTPERWTTGLAGIRYVGSEPEPLTLACEARQLAYVRYASGTYCEWVEANGDLRWNMDALNMQFTGTLAADGSASAPQIVKKGRYEIMEGPWAIRPHCLPDLLDTLLKHRTPYLEQLREYRAGKRTLTGLVHGDDDD